jgi:hypothetical protein
MLFLIEYDREKAQLLSIRPFADAQRLDAERARIEREIEFHRQGLFREIVLLEAASEADLHRTHGRYFKGLAALMMPEGNAPPVVVLPVDPARAARRAQWPVRVMRLEDASHDDVAAYTTAAERVLMVAQLTAEAWALSGWPTPAYERSRTPIALRPMRTMQG